MFHSFKFYDTQNKTATKTDNSRENNRSHQLLSLGSKGFHFRRKTDEMMKTRRRVENINFLRNWRNSGFVAKFLTKFAPFDKRKMAFFVAKTGEDLEKALSHKFNHVTFYS